MAHGKGAIDCDSGRIFAWSMALEAPPAPSAGEVLKGFAPPQALTPPRTWWSPAPEAEVSSKVS